MNTIQVIARDVVTDEISPIGQFTVDVFPALFDSLKKHGAYFAGDSERKPNECQWVLDENGAFFEICYSDSE